MTQPALTLTVRVTAAELGRVLAGQPLTVPTTAGLVFVLELRGENPPPPAAGSRVPRPEPPPPEDPAAAAARLQRMNENLERERQAHQAALDAFGVGGRIATNGD